MSLWAFVFSVLLCNSVRKRTHLVYEMTHKQLGGGVFPSQWGVFSLTERTEFTEPFGAHFELTELTEPFCARFEPTEGLRHTENAERYCYRWGENCEK